MVNLKFIGGLFKSSTVRAFAKSAQAEGSTLTKVTSKSGIKVFSWLEKDGTQVFESLDKNGNPLRSVRRKIKDIETLQKRGYKAKTGEHYNTEVIDHKTGLFRGRDTYRNFDGKFSTHSRIENLEGGVRRLNSQDKNSLTLMDSFYYQNKELIGHSHSHRSLNKSFSSEYNKDIYDGKFYHSITGNYTTPNGKMHSFDSWLYPKGLDFSSNMSALRA